MLLGTRRALVCKGQNAAAPAWAPTDLASLLAWWRSDGNIYEDAAGTIPATDDGDVVGQQADQATVGPYNATQPTTANKPTLQNAAGDLINGNAVIRGDGLDDYLLTTLAPPASGTLAMSFKYHGTTAKYPFGAYDGTAPGHRCYFYINATPKLCAGIGTQNFTVIIDSGAALNNGSVYVAVLTWDGATVVLRKNGVQGYSAAQAGTPAGVQPVYLYALNNNGVAVSAGPTDDWVDIIMCSAALTGVDLSNLETWMANRVGVVLP